jgi:hypothetical protein
MERVLLLTPQSEFGELLAESLQRYRIDLVRWSRSPKNLQWRWSELLDTDIIIVDVNFCGNSRDTAALVRQIRQHFTNPMIAFAEFATNEGSFPCQVAGCNFLVTGTSKNDLRGNLCQNAGSIFEELKRDHRKVPA